MKIVLSSFVVGLLSIQLYALASEEVVMRESPTVTAAVAAESSAKKTVTPIKSEEEIPLRIDQVKKVPVMASMPERLVMTGIIISILLSATYYFVKKYKNSNSIHKSNKKIKILSQHYLGPKKSLALVHVAGESVLIGITDTNISLIKSIALIDDEIPTESTKNFSDVMNLENVKMANSKDTNNILAEQKIVQVNKSIGSKNVVGTMSTEELEEEFSFSGLKDSVSKKLKSMRSI